MLVGMRAFAALVLIGLFVRVGVAQAALPPEAYEQIRQMAPLAFVGVVQQDPGGQALVRVEHVARGALGMGQVVTVIYPVAAGYAPPGPQVHYRAFNVGTRLRVFGQPGYDGRSVRIVDGGIDVLTGPAKTKSGCAACAVGSGTRSSPSGVWWAFVAALVWGLRRAAAALALTACTGAGPTPPPPGPQPVSGPAPDDGVEVATEGNSTVTVLNRPDHPSVKPPPNAQPAPRTTSECRMQQECATQGLCTSTGTACVAAAYTDCLEMRGCATGKCDFAAGVCTIVATCTDSHDCREAGACVDRGAGCVADADGCQQSALCKTSGRCSIDDGICIAATDADCKDTEACTNDGRCKADAGRCIADTDLACKRAPACKERGQCLARDGVCVKSCVDGELCKKHGRCGERAKMAGSCVALSDEDCNKSEVCADLGHCSLGLDARCEAGDDVECRLSRTCKEDGRCTHQRGRCLPASDAECKAATVACKREGRCKHDAGQCVKG